MKENWIIVLHGSAFIKNRRWDVTYDAEKAHGFHYKKDALKAAQDFLRVPSSDAPWCQVKRRKDFL